MRRVLAAFMVLMMAAAAGSAHAAGFGLLSTPVPQATEQISAFTFRNGISWNMSTEQVRSLEVTPMNERTSGEWSVMMTAEKVAVSRFTADLVFIFRQNQLRMITYEFNHNNDSVISFYYLIGALEFKYGKSQDAEPQIVKNLMDRIDPNHYQTERIQQVHAWTDKDGTGIYLYYFDTDRFAILYASPELSATGGGYDVNGL